MFADASEEAGKELVNKLWTFVTTVDNWVSFRGLIAAAILAVAAVWLLRQLLEMVAKSIESWHNIGLPTMMSTTERQHLLRRSLFCKMLRGDVQTLNKAENWNDQFFTDLEAEIEIEGFYYASPIHRLFRRRSQGLRRCNSLMDAIQSSVEPALLVVGEPGSGKSVALRHLAHQLADNAVQSSDGKAKVPLYINLKELPAAALEAPDADFIQSFIMDHVRRGDADTAQFLRENWADYRQRGIWYFLFDSFDEIPAVMHAPTNSPIIQRYTEAIRQFLAGMSDCRGCVASREFKGPNNLPWPKLRILPLSSIKQEDLIRNTFMDASQKALVRRHLASRSSILALNPLFLTLLCRFVRLRNEPPINDHDLLRQHIDDLATRDSEYLDKHYQLRPHDLIRGAMRIATLFAENQSLSLAPTFEQIASVLKPLPACIADLDRLLRALVDVKIGRSDVHEARSGDRRFSFSHRRYQETLFCRVLADDPSYLPSNELITNSRWREYSVTLLQTQTKERILPLLDAATVVLKKAARVQQAIAATPYVRSAAAYYDWHGSSHEIADLLHLLQEGLSARLSDLPGSLQDAVELFLGPRWTNGDWFDQKGVLELSGTLPQTVLCDRLGVAVRDGTPDFQNVVFRQIAHVVDLPPNLALWVRRRLSDEVLRAKDKNEMLRLEALSYRLPERVGAILVLDRSRKLARLGRGLLPGPALTILSLVCGGIFVFAFSAAELASGDQVFWYVPACAAVVATLYGMSLAAMYCCRTAGERIGPRVLVRELRRADFISLEPMLVRLSWTVLLFVVGLLLLMLAAERLVRFRGSSGPMKLESIDIRWMLAAYVCAIFSPWILLRISRKISQNRLMRAIRRHKVNPEWLLGARSLLELSTWMPTALDVILATYHERRSFLCAVGRIEGKLPAAAGLGTVFRLYVSPIRVWHTVIDSLIRAISKTLSGVREFGGTQVLEDHPGKDDSI
jgi:hypothetical protein